MENKKITKGISNKKCYRYIWDEATNFITYQNEDGNLIFGLSPHDGKVEEEEILKLYEISLKSFKVNPVGEEQSFKFEHTVYPKNFYSLVDEEKSNVCIPNIIHYLGATTSYFTDDKLKQYETIKFDKNVNYGWYSPTNNFEKIPTYWDFPVKNQKEVNKMVDYTLQKILSFLYNVGKIRYFYNTYDNEVHLDHDNRFLAMLIHNVYFPRDQFDVIEDREENIENIYEEAHKENELYNDYMEILETFNEKNFNFQESETDHLLAAKAAISYRKITGKRYDFAKVYSKKYHSE